MTNATTLTLNEKLEAIEEMRAAAKRILGALDAGACAETDEDADVAIADALEAAREMKAEAP